MKTHLGVVLILYMVVLVLAVGGKQIRHLDRLDEASSSPHDANPFLPSELEDDFDEFDEEPKHLSDEPSAVPEPPTTCPDDYSPYCNCIKINYPIRRRTLTCRVSTNQEFDTIRTKLSNVSKINFYRVYLVVTATVVIPGDVFGTIKTAHLTLSCSDRSLPLIVHADAFTSTKNKTKILKIQDCDLTRTSFAFLSEFQVINKLRLTSSYVKEVLEMPYLPQLKVISFAGSSDLEKWYLSSQTPNLRKINLSKMPDLDDRKMNSIFFSMTNNFIYPKLSHLRISKSGLTRVPPLVSIFPALTELNLNGNPIKTLAVGSIKKRSSQLKYLGLSETGLTIIEPGAFVGDFSSTYFGFRNNPTMMSFPSLVFKDLLISMVNRGGSVDISNNPIVFDCNLKWLLVDNRDLLPYVEDGAISNGTLFKHLNPQELINC